MFELHITCTKDIDRIKIDFSDGTVCTSENTKHKSIDKSNKDGIIKDKKVNHRDMIKHEDIPQSEVIVEKPSIPEVTETKVEDYLQGLDF